MSDPTLAEKLVRAVAAMMAEDRVIRDWGAVPKEKYQELIEQAGMKAIEDPACGVCGLPQDKVK